MPVLFLDDWKKYNAVADITTKNRSFVHMARLLKSMGVKNHMFMLALLDRSLVGVNPHDPNLSPEMIAKVARECYLNPWYFFREVVRAPGESGAPPRMFEANRGNMALFWSFLNGALTLIIQSRQTGKSFSTDCMLVWLLQVRSRNLTINILTKDEKLRKSNVDRLKRIMGALPSYLDQRTKKDANNTELVTVNTYENKVYTHLPSADKKRADNAARGMTSAVAVVDEPPYQVNIQISLPVALSSGGAARELAALNGDPHGTILTTTAGKKDTPEGKFIYDLMNNTMASWTESFFDSENRAVLEDAVRKTCRVEREYRIAIVMDHRQLGKTDEWLLKRISDSVSSGEGADRDYFNRWTSGTATNPLSVATLAKINESIREPKFVEHTKIGNYQVRWHINEEEIKTRMAMNHHLVVFDTSEAAGGDAISMRVTDLYTGELMAAATINDTNIITFAEWTSTWVTKYTNTTLLIERRSTGGAVLDLLMRILPSMGIDPYKRIWNRIVNEPAENRERYEEACWALWRRSDEEHYVRNKSYFGFATSAAGLTSRKNLYSSVLQSAARQVGHLVGDKETVTQISSLIQKNGRVDHPPGQHDDMCFVGSTLVRTINGNKPIKQIRLGDLVLTRQGYKPVIRLFKSEKEVITQHGLTGTPNHPFITPSGEIEFKDVKPETEVYVWNEKQSCIEVKRITDTLNRTDLNIENTSTDTTNGTNRLLRYTGKFTKTTSDLFHQAITSIIKTTTISTTVPKILNACRSLNISKDIAKNISKPLEIYPLKNVSAEEKTWLDGTGKIKSLPPDYHAKMVANHEVSSTGERTIQNLPENTQGEPFKSESRKELVYNFMVADCHEYFVNDILVHNCIGWLLTHWFITKAQNLSFYGIDATALLRDVREVSELTPEQKLRDQQQRRLRQRVEELTELIKTTPEDVLQMRYEHELRLHYSRMEFMENDRISVDEVIKAAREERSRRRYSNPSQGNPVQARNSFHNKMRDFQIRATSMSGFGR